MTVMIVATVAVVKISKWIVQIEWADLSMLVSLIVM